MAEHVDIHEVMNYANAPQADRFNGVIAGDPAADYFGRPEIQAHIIYPEEETAGPLSGIEKQRHDSRQAGRDWEIAHLERQRALVFGANKSLIVGKVASPTDI